MSKRDQANQYLQVARQQRRIFASPADALDASFILRSPQAGPAPQPIGDQPLGVESFQDSNIQGYLSADRSEISEGEVVKAVLQLVSAGRSTALLVKVTDIEPPGLEVEIIGEKYRVEEGEVSFRGRRLEPFETLDIEMGIKASREGVFMFQPSVLYLDEGGRYRSYKPSGRTFRVLPSAEAGRGPVAQTVLEIQFRSPAAQKVFESLVVAFVEDYMVKKIYLDQAGWRSLTKLSELSGIPHASLYGKQARYGRAVDELLSRGLVEKRVLTGQRGRGGEVIKMRIAYGKEPVKRYVDNRVMKPRDE